MTNRILCVDDDANILLGYQRALRKQFQIEVALGGEEGLAAIRNQGPYAVVVSDMRMPGMTGIEMLAQAKKIAPQTVRMMLTGNSDQQTALDAVNEGHIFRFLTKPCTPEAFAKALEAGLAQYRLIMAEKELLSKTVSGAIKMLTDVLAMVSPIAFGRASRARTLSRGIAREMGLTDTWMIEIAAMLSQVGCVAMPDEVLAKHARGEVLSRREQEAFAAYPLIGRDLIQSIPRFEGVAEVVAYQQKRFDGEGPPPDNRSAQAIPIGSRILKAALDYDALAAAGTPPGMILGEMMHREGWYDPDVLDALKRSLHVSRAYVVAEVKVDQLKEGMILAADLRTLQGTLLCAKGQEITAAMRVRLRNYVCNLGLRGTLQVFLPVDRDELPPVAWTPPQPEDLAAALSPLLDCPDL